MEKDLHVMIKLDTIYVPQRTMERENGCMCMFGNISMVQSLKDMKNVKDQVYAALCTVSENVSDAYPRSWAEGSTIQYTEEQNDVYEASSDAEGMREDKALVRYRIDIWNNHSTSEAALQVDEAMKVTGLKRIACADVPDPSGMKHKQMRYEGIIDMDSDSVYWR